MGLNYRFRKTCMILAGTKRGGGVEKTILLFCLHLLSSIPDVLFKFNFFRIPVCCWARMKLRLTMFQRHNLILSSFCASSMRFLSEWATIFGCATPRVKCAVSVIRISGPNALKAVSSMTSIDLNKVRSRYAYVTLLRHAIHQGSILDEVLLLVFKAPKSYTGEHVVEFHCHGGKVSSCSSL